jgi:hypothetical protein
MGIVSQVGFAVNMLAWFFLCARIGENSDLGSSAEEYAITLERTCG